MAGYDVTVPPIATTMFRSDDGLIDPVWNEYFNKLVGQPEFLNVTEVLSTKILVGYEIYSTDYVTGTTGWRIASDAGVGVAEFNIPIVSYANITGTKPPIDADATATVILGGLVTTGSLTVTQGGTVAAGVTGDTSGDTAVRIFAGSTYANRNSAPFRVRQDGVAYMEAAVIGSSVALTSTATSLTVSGGSGAGNKIEFGSGGGSISGTSGNVGVVATGSGYVYMNSTSQQIRFSGAIFFPNVNNTVDLGSTGNSFKNLYLTNTISCSVVSATTITGTSVNGTTVNSSAFNGSSVIITGASSVTLKQGIYQAVLQSANFRPASNNLCNLGFTNFRWNRLYVSGVTVGTTSVHDVLDDLQALHSIKTDENGDMDILTMPERVVTYSDARRYLKSKKGNNLSDSNINQALRDHKDSAHLLGVDLASFVNLVEGAVRQLDTETDSVSRQILDWQANMEKRIKKLEEAK